MSDSIHAFDMVLNTGKISPDLATNWLVDIAKVPVSSFEIDKPTTDSIVVDRILAETVSEVLNCDNAHR